MFKTLVVLFIYHLCAFTKINTKFGDKNLEPDDFMSTFAVSKVRCFFAACPGRKNFLGAQAFLPNWSPKISRTNDMRKI
jgi:hypothetical protein